MTEKLRLSRRRVQKLYWCETPDHDEDWFIVASSAKEACRIHEAQEGYGKSYARSRLVCRIPSALAPATGWPSQELLEALGGVFLSNSTPRVVQYGQTVYVEGGMDAVLRRLEDDQAEAMGKGRPQGTTRLQ
ncbi:MAG: hypothetical protein HYZ50_08510 [Deltaproteobacteria bacterium]|nr:hypothetical protein [Deltaproteobacteria bacterium]